LIYYYFKSKEELFREALKLELENVKSELSQIARKKSDSLTMLETYIIKRMKLLSKAYNYHETLKADFFEKYHFVKDVRDDFYEFELNQITYILKKGNKEGFLEIKNITKTVNIIMMMITSTEIPLFLQNKYAEYKDTLRDMALMVLGSIRNQKKQLKGRTI
ncbi:MAG: hypothetical protein KA792_09040, partial [Bacteroidales bacterium]|nr:hypothetical protein [Bacteroidales bacterium]